MLCGRLSRIAGGGVRTLWPVGPLLEPGAAPVIAKPDDPQVPVLLAGRARVDDISPDHRRGAVNSEDVGGHGENLARSFSLGVNGGIFLLTAKFQDTSQTRSLMTGKVFMGRTAIAWSAG